MGAAEASSLREINKAIEKLMGGLVKCVLLSYKF